METQAIANSAPSTQSNQTPAISSISTSYLCQTEGVVNEIDFKWTIERLAFFGSFGMCWESLTSPEFSDGKFKLELDPSGDYLSIKLIHSNILRYPITVEITFCDENCKSIFRNTLGISGNLAGSPLLVLRIPKKELLETWDFVNGKTTICCKIKSLARKHLTVKSSQKKTQLTNTPTSRDRDQQDLILCELEELFDKMPLSDVTFIIRGQTFAAHKAILAMRSPVFAAMFLHPTKEVQTGEVKVDDIDPDVFQEVLRYVYTGLARSTTMDIMAPGLLAAADKYFMDQLKTRCETHLIRQMSVKNCLDLLALTITHHPAEHLKKFAIEYFRRYPGKFMLK
jgi:speckle-type POZ protein